MIAPDAFAVELDPPPPEAMAVAHGLVAAGHAAYFVGGAVRDRLLGREVGDWDIATDAEPEAVMGCFERAIPTGLQHGTVTVVVDHHPVEVTTYRVERGYSDGRRPDEVAYTRLLRDDLGRRDFTVNAMAWDPIAGVIVDPYGGRVDLERRVLRAVGAAIERFTEDGLRALRAVRFACVLDMALDPATEAAIPETLATFRKVSAERIRIEFGKICRAPRVAWGIEALRRTGLLDEFLPEALEQSDADWRRALDALAAPPPDEIGRLGVLLARAAVDPEVVMRRLKYSNDERRTLAHLHRWRALDPHVERADAEVRRQLAAIGAGPWPSVRAMHEALARVDGTPAVDAWARFGARVERLDAVHGPHRPKDLALDGRGVMHALGVPPSRRIGRLLQALLERVWAEPELNTVEGLTALLPEVEAGLDADEQGSASR